MNGALGFTEKPKHVFHNFSADKNDLGTILYITIMGLHDIYPPPLSTSIYWKGPAVIFCCVTLECHSEVGRGGVFPHGANAEAGDPV